MNFEVNSTNPAVKAIIAGTAPRPAQLAAARGILPLSQTDLLEVLVALADGEDRELKQSASETLQLQDGGEIESIVKSTDVAPRVLDYFAEQNNVPKAIHEAILTNPNTSGATIIKFARNTSNGELLELVSFNQQLLIKTPAIIDAIIANPYRTAEAERKASEVKREFFEKARGAAQIAGELRAQGKNAAAEFIEQAEFAGNLRETSSISNLSFEDAILLAEHIEVPDSETDDGWLSLEYIEEFYEETDEQRQSIVNKILGELKAEDDEISGDRVSMINRILRMTMKDRVKLAMKGDREARNILIRDPNRIVAQAVINNARITEQEVEKIAAMRTVPEEVLRQIGINRAWARNYTIMHNLARNPRVPLGNVITILSRLQLRDLQAISKNRNVSDAVRRQALRLSQARAGR
ncbi:MAG TPA: hypothetical protein VNI84_14920 [Pyrinomonadaceae bacterium]|nr:hypothetical protein [Pyrinomonadaceae bacterium]